MARGLPLPLPSKWMRIPARGRLGPDCAGAGLSSLLVDALQDCSSFGTLPIQPDSNLISGEFPGERFRLIIERSLEGEGVLRDLTIRYRGRLSIASEGSSQRRLRSRQVQYKFGSVRRLSLPRARQGGLSVNRRGDRDRQHCASCNSLHGYLIRRSLCLCPSTITRNG